MQPLPKMPIGEGSAGKGTSPEGGAIVVRTSIREGRLTDAGPLGPIDPLQNVRRLGLAPILTSEGLGWRGIKAERFRHSLREIEQPPFQNHLITHMAELVRFERRRGGRVDKGYHAPGNVGLIPAGGPAARWILEGEADGLQLSLDPAIIEGVAEEIHRSSGHGHRLRRQGDRDSPRGAAPRRRLPGTIRALRRGVRGTHDGRVTARSEV